MMMRNGIGRAAVLAAGLLSGAAVLASGRNLIPNPGFEKLDEDGFPLKWKFFRKDQDAATVVRDGAAAGKNLLRVTRNSRRDAFVRSDIFPLRPGKYQISLQLRGSGKATVTMSVYHPVRTLPLRTVELTDRWQTVSTEFEVPAKATQASLGVRVSGSADIDDAQLRVFGAAPVEVEVVNAGSPGNNSFDLLTRLNTDVLSEDPDTVILLCGTNDMVNSKKPVPFARYETNLEQIITTLKNQNIRVMLMTPIPCYEPYILRRHDPAFFTPLSPNAKLEKAGEIVRKLAKKHGCPLVDLWTLFKERGEIGETAASWLRNPANGRSVDGVHPVGPGYAQIAKAVGAAMKEAGLKPKKIVCFGDSITFGIGAAKPEESYPEQLELELNRQ
ncbi:MAG: GDSL-type esterase/lipase family protein [Lentisphaeria bacterium]|nr:GDSL-type esterase/lipase family protein [Lentisphaeria bacterium]